MHVLIVMDKGVIEELRLYRGVIEAEVAYVDAIREAGYRDEDEMRDALEGKNIILWQNAEEG